MQNEKSIHKYWGADISFVKSDALEIFLSTLQNSLNVSFTINKIHSTYSCNRFKATKKCAAINLFYCQTSAFHNQILPGSEDNEKRVYNTSNIHYNVLWYTTNKFYKQELVTNNSDETIGGQYISEYSLMENWMNSHWPEKSHSSQSRFIRFCSDYLSQLKCVMWTVGVVSKGHLLQPRYRRCAFLDC